MPVRCSLGHKSAGHLLTAGLAKQSERLVGIQTGFPAGKEAEGEGIKGYSLCVLVPYPVGHRIQHLSTKWV